MNTRSPRPAESRPGKPGKVALLQGPEDRRALVVMSVGHGIQHFYVAGLAVTYPFVISALHVSYGELGVVLTVAGILGGLLQGAAGLLRGASARLVLGAQNAGLALSSILGAVAPGFGLFALARVFGALTSWPQHPVGSAYLSERFPHRRSTVLSLHTAGGSAGTVTVPLIVAAVIAAAGWRWALVVLTVFLAVGALLVATALPAEKAVPVEHSDVERVSVRDLLRNRSVIAVLAASTVAAGGRGLGTLGTFIPADLKTHLGLSAITVGAIFTVVMAASIAGPLVGGSLADRFGRRSTLVITYMAGAAAIAAFGYSSGSMFVLVPLGLALGLLAYTESPLIQALFSDLTSKGDARSAFGVFFAIAYGVGSLWTALLGWIIDTAGFPAAFATMAGSFVIAGLIIAFGIRQHA